ncbi:MAG: hypothetical protein A2252_08085 [Elusimicrobia bacterium RIFOXYA2_FULL_39_19]|nr:MAG: hypothetical protein A2252_08085 [Elusimicrobia bacterium RIFOXYA2_FULL_39_19]
MIKKPEQGMTIIVKTITRYTVVLILLFGIYFIMNGHLVHGGGFAGGIIVALSYMHVMLAFGKEVAMKRITDKTIQFLVGLGSLSFLILGILGMTKGYFMYNFFRTPGVDYIGKPFSLFSSGIMPLMNLAICLAVASGFFSVFLALIFYRLSEDKK